MHVKNKINKKDSIIANSQEHYPANEINKKKT